MPLAYVRATHLDAGKSCQAFGTRSMVHNHWMELFSGERVTIQRIETIRSRLGSVTESGGSTLAKVWVCMSSV